jgi:hypothetical protein
MKEERIAILRRGGDTDTDTDTDTEYTDDRACMRAKMDGPHVPLPS